MWEPHREGGSELLSSSMMTSIAHQTMPGHSTLLQKAANNIGLADMDENDTWNDIPPPPPPMSPAPSAASLLTPNDLMNKTKQLQNNYNLISGRGNNDRSDAVVTNSITNNESFCDLGDDTMSAMGAADLILSTPAPPPRSQSTQGGVIARAPFSAPSMQEAVREKSATFSADFRAKRWGENGGSAITAARNGENALFPADFGKSDESLLKGGNETMGKLGWQKTNRQYSAANNITASLSGLETINDSCREGRHVHFGGEGGHFGRTADGNENNCQLSASYDKYAGKEGEKSQVHQISIDQETHTSIYEDAVKEQRNQPIMDAYKAMAGDGRFEDGYTNQRQSYTPMQQEIPQNNITRSFLGDNLIENSSHQQMKTESEEERLSPEMLWLKSMGEYQQQQQISSDDELLESKHTKNFEDSHLDYSAIESAYSIETRSKTGASDVVLNNGASIGSRHQQYLSQPEIAAVPTESGWMRDMEDNNSAVEHNAQISTNPETIKATSDDNMEKNDDASASSSVDSNAICGGNDSMTVEEMIKLGEQQMLNQSTASSTLIDNPHMSLVTHPPSVDADEMDDSYSISGNAAKECPPSSRRNNNYDEKEGQPEKKPFLRKGSRKEPSALLRKGSENKSSSQKTSKQKLEELEKMQRDQLEQLEQRKKRIEAQRQKQMKGKRQSATKQKKEFLVNESQSRSETPSRRGNMKELQSKNRRKKQLAQKVEQEEHSDEEDANDYDKENMPMKDEHSDIEAYSSDDEDDSDQHRNSKLRDIKNIANEGRVRESLTPMKKKTASKTKSKDTACRALSAKKRRSPLKTSNRSDSCKQEDEERQKQYEEQWQMLKSMRKRQEVALREAERERETARAWAVAEKENVQKWVKEQRAMIQRDRHRANNAAMVSQRKKQQDQCDRRRAAAAEKAHKREQEEIEALRATVEKLKIDLDANKGRHKANEKKLKERIREREQEIEQLREKATAFEHAQAKPPTSNKGSGTKRPASSRKNKTDGKSEKDSMAEYNRSEFEQNGESEVVRKRTTSGKKKISSRSKSPKVDTSREKEEHIGLVIEAKCENGNTHYSNKLDNDLEGNECMKQNDGHPIDIGPVEQSLSMPSELTEEPTEVWFQRQVNRLQKNKPNAPLAGVAKEGLIQKSNDGDISCEKNVYLPSKEIEQSQSRPFPDVFEFSQNKKPYNASNYAASIFASGERNQAEVKQEKTPLSQPVQMSGKGTSSGRGRTTELLPDGRQVISYRNGTQKEICVDGSTIVRFANGDIKTTYVNQSKETYFYAATQTTHTTHRDGLQIYEFPNEQVEHHYPSGKKEIMFPDGTKKIMFPDGFNETRFSDGVRMIEYPNGEKQVTRS